MTTKRVVIVDNMGVPRVWGEGPTKDIAETRAWDEFRERGYIRRHDLRPFEARVET